MDGTVVWQVESAPPAPDGYWSGGLSMADLDADGDYEIVDWSMSGLRILDGDGTVLGQRTDIVNDAFWSSPVIADVDGDGSAEIVVVGEPADTELCANDHIYILGPASGRWARTRPVWNQTAYDVTTVRDDASIVVFPYANWQTYNTFRAQPAHDGDHPDLTVRVTDMCATTCGPGGEIELNAVVENLGSAEAPAGAEVVLYRWTDAEHALTPIARATLPEAVPSMTAAEGVVLTVPWEEWGELRALEVNGAHADECDRVNDRIEVWDDPCAE